VERHEIEHEGETYLVEAHVCAADPSVGIMSRFSEDHGLLDPDTEEPLAVAVQNAKSDAFWEAIAEKFDEKIEPYDDHQDYDD